MMRNQIAEIRISGEIEDITGGFSIFGGRANSLHRITDQLDKARTDESVSGVLLNIKSFRTGLATVQELKKKIDALKKAGKPVVAYLEEGGGDRSLLLASSADRIIISPSSYITLLGPRAEVLMLKGLMDKLGVEADMLRAGKFKSAVEPYTRERLSDEVKEEYQVVIDELYDQLTGPIAQGRDLQLDDLMRMMDERGAWWPEDAREKGLIDEVGYYEDAKSLISELVGSSKRGEKVKTVRLARRHYTHYDWKYPPKIGVIFASGRIVPGRSYTDWMDGSRSLGSETLVNQIKKASRDPTIRAIILRVDSPGGDGLASDLIWREVKKTSETDKPIIVSMGDVAASGGYYISSSADRIIADPGTITGSIGVFGGKLVLEKTYEKLDLFPEIIKRSEHADAFSSSRRFTEEERQIFQEHINHFYSSFVKKVADGRGLSYEAVDEVAQGRIWTGNQAKERGLVDQLGTLEDAIEIAKERAGIKGDAQIKYITPGRSFFSYLFSD
jgi:protease-4